MPGITSSSVPATTGRAGLFRRAAQVAGVGGLVLLLSGCLTFDVDVAVNADDTLDGSVILAVDDQILELSGQNPDELLADAAPDAADCESVTFADYQQGGETGKQADVVGCSLEAFNDAAAGAGGFSIVHDGDQFVVDGLLDLTEAPGGLDPELLADAVLRVRLTFPGAVIESNGEVDGRSVTWLPVMGAKNEIHAVASAEPGGAPAAPGAGEDSADDGGPLLWLLLGAFAVLILAAGFFLFWTMRRTRTSSVDEPDPDAA